MNTNTKTQKMTEEEEKWLQEYYQEILNSTGDKEEAEKEVEYIKKMGAVGVMSPKDTADMMLM